MDDIVSPSWAPTLGSNPKSLDCSMGHAQKSCALSPRVVAAAVGFMRLGYLWRPKDLLFRILDGALRAEYVGTCEARVCFVEDVLSLRPCP